MTCANPRCGCGALDGGFCCDGCAADISRMETDDGCQCRHQGCETARGAPGP